MEASTIRPAELLDPRRRLADLGDLDAAASRPLTGRWDLAATARDDRAGDLVLDRRNLRLELRGLTAAEIRDPSIRCWQEGLRSCPDLYTKLVVYARPGGLESWITAGYLFEGVVAGYFADGDDAHLWAAFGTDERSDAPRDAVHDETVRLAATRPLAAPADPGDVACRRAVPEQAPLLAALLADTFPDYPTPITATGIAERIDAGSHVYRYLADDAGAVVATAAAAVDRARRNAALVDCATRADRRGAGHMTYLLHRLARDLEEGEGITDVHTLARADEVGMNCVCGKLGFRYTGRLVNDCRMPNGWESMNVWCRRAEDGAEGSGSAA